MPARLAESRPRGVVFGGRSRFHRARMVAVHDDQIDINLGQVVALVSDQLPDLVGMDVVAIASAGTVNAIFRIGDEVTARFPLRRADPDQVRHDLQREMRAAIEFHRVCPVPSAEPFHLGSPGHGYPLPWTAQSWIPGTMASPTSCQYSSAIAHELALLTERLRAVDTRGRSFGGSGRGGVLSDHDVWVEECIARSEGLVDTEAMRVMWQRFRVLPREGPDAMCHGDLTPSNLLVAGEHLVGVLEAGGFGAADPALDLVGAWHLLASASREEFRVAVGCDDLQWERGKAWAFEQAAGAYWYYRDTNQAMAEMGRTTLHRLLTEA